jgi:hypothetical protein
VALFLPSSAPAKGIDRLSAIAQSATIDWLEPHLALARS